MVFGNRQSADQGEAKFDENFLANLVQMYDAYEEKNLPYDEKVRLLALIPKEWNLSVTSIMERFGCTRHAVKESRTLRDTTSTPLYAEEKP